MRSDIVLHVKPGSLVSIYLQLVSRICLLLLLHFGRIFFENIYFIQCFDSANFLTVPFSYIISTLDPPIVEQAVDHGEFRTAEQTINTYNKAESLGIRDR